jgi:hypothetical protein
VTQHESYRVSALYNLGFYEACVEVGRFTSSTAHHHPGHRHTHVSNGTSHLSREKLISMQLALFYVGLAACEMARVHLEDDTFISVAKKHLAELAVYLEPSKINIGSSPYS